jgi:hypothetical protein
VRRYRHRAKSSASGVVRLARWTSAPPRYGYAVPVEGQWERQQTPLRRLGRRERRLLRAFVVLLLAATVAVALFAALHKPAPVPADCIQVTGPSTLGAAVYRECGVAAVRWCREEAGKQGPLARAVQARCRTFNRR